MTYFTAYNVSIATALDAPKTDAQKCGTACLATDRHFSETRHTKPPSGESNQTPLGWDVGYSPISPPLEVLPLLVSGPSSNRVDLVFFSDGYVQSEREKFFNDAKRLAEDVSKNQTFYTVQPLLNFWAAFTPSDESGIGTHGVPKDTPFELYRDGTELRGVYYGKPEVARAACDALGDRCNYPILLGNDPLYGGLGGDFTVVTSSILNGPLVLRHELGHSIIEVGEEYDGGFAYFGVNAAHDPQDSLQDVPWKQWLSDPSRLDGSKPHIERSVMPMQAYPWTMLNTTTPWAVKFTSAGTYSRYLVKFSLSGIPESTDLRVTLDGKDLHWRPKAGLGLDRWHYDLHFEEPLTGGVHELGFTLLNVGREGVAQLCSTEIIEFGNEAEFISKPGFYSLYPTYSETNKTSYRPTNDDCLMRTVTTPNFCKVCIEGLWRSLLSKISLIDNLNSTCAWDSSSQSWNRELRLGLIPVAHLRAQADHSASFPGEAYTVIWRKDGQLLPQLANQTTVRIPDEQSLGRYQVTVKFWTEEIRKESWWPVSDIDLKVDVGCASLST
ncbi:IgA peptidase M64-domain-containing protein [Panaeolus papilionaceus]|nr:IgA peptidase M64-domain-containing protein [Panaeolus papilionaceus]